jgi:hypothetical protein
MKWDACSRCIVMSLLLGFCGISVGNAQSVSGRVVLADSSTTAPGAIVQATDERGAAVRALTNSAGRFVLRVAHPGRYVFQVLRIGYRPSVVRVIVVGMNGERDLTLIAGQDRVSLAAVTVRAANSCRVRPDTGLLVARVWEEARKAMLSSQLTTDDAPVQAEWMEFDRALDSSAGLVKKQHVTMARHPTTHVFRTPSPDSLATLGYVINESGGVAYYAPDAEVLLSERFANTHCLRLTASGNDDTSMVGVRFEPTEERRGVHDIAGILWVDRQSAELRRLEFQYTNLPDVSDPLRGGGRVGFARLAAGSWIITSWEARLPIFEQRERSAGIAALRATTATPATIVRAVHVTGGEVGRVVRGDSVLFTRQGARVRLQFQSTDAGVPSSGVSVVLEGTNISGVSDADGFITLGPIPDGRYRASIVIPVFDSLGTLPLEREVVTHIDARVDSVALPRAKQLIGRLCASTSGDLTGMLRGSVRTADGVPVSGASVTVTYSRVDARALAAKLVSSRQETIGAVTDGRGRWQLCGIPHENDILLSVVRDSSADHRVFRLEDARVFGTVDLVLHPVKAKAAAESSTAAGESRALLEFIVATTEGVPLGEVALDVRAQDGIARRVVTGVTGHALIPDLPVGDVAVMARRIGYQPGELVFGIGSGHNTAPIQLNTVARPMLDTVRILGGRRVDGRLDAFESRRITKATTRSIGREEIERRHPTDAWQMLLDIPSVKVVPYAQGVYVMSARGKRASFGDPTAPCPMNVMVDGVPITPRDANGVDVSDLPRPDAIYGIEVFAGDAKVPTEFGGLGSNKSCGLIAIWTR